MAYSDSDIKERIRESTPIVDLVSSYGFDLRRSGTNRFVTQCPWHNDTRPSLQINPGRESWKCWVCDDKGGDVFNFVMEMDKVTFPEAIEILADRAGIALSAKDKYRSKAPPGSPNDKKTLLRALAWAEDCFHHYLVADPGTHAQQAREYLSGRHISAESIDQFRLGSSPHGDWLLGKAKSAGFSPDVLLAAGLVGQNDQQRFYDFFQRRLMFSIRDERGQPIAFGGRVLPGDPNPAKYKNTRETSVFSKHRQLYALDIAKSALKEKKHLIVVEGYTDVVLAHQYGVANVVAVLGTALGRDHVKVLKRFADRITLVLDGDEAGQRRAGQVLEFFVAEQVDLRILTLPEGKDPCDFVLEDGADEFNRRVDAAVDALEHKVRIETRGIDLIRDTDRANRALEAILDTFAKAPRLSVSTTHDRRLREGQLLSRLAREFGVVESEIRRRLADLRNKQASTPIHLEPETQKESDVISTLDSAEVELLEILSLETSLVEHLIESKLDRSLLRSEPTKEILRTIEQIAAETSVDFGRVMSALTTTQLKNIWVTLAESAERKSQHPTASGKTRLLKTIEMIKERRGKQERQITEANLSNMSPEDQIHTLQELIQLQRERHEQQLAQTAHGRSDPMDG